MSRTIENLQTLDLIYIKNFLSLTKDLHLDASKTGMLSCTKLMENGFNIGNGIGEFNYFYNGNSK